MKEMANHIPHGFTEKELEHYSRQIVLKDFGIKAQRKLKKAKICIVGAGGLGSPISIQLASMGVGHIRIIDRDIVETSNLQRQHLYSIDQVGLPKVEAAAHRLNKINPFINVEPIPMSLTHKNAQNLLKGFDVVVDGLDAMTPRYAINRACQKNGTPYVFGAVITQVGNASTIIPGETACIECFQGGIDDENVPNCSILGVHPSIISMVASIQVSETIRLLTDQDPVLANKLVFCDLKDLTLEKIQLTKLESCPVCGTSKNKPFELKHNEIEEICGRGGRRVFVFSPSESMDINLETFNNNLKSHGYQIEVEASLGTTFSKEKLKASILKSGVSIIEGVEGLEEAKSIRFELLDF
jgi:adenylyltransferase/sulfurtransferase